MPRVPARFVGLHNHTGFSPFDGLGYPDEHFRWCLENGIDAHAITEHGNMNSYAHAQLWVEDWAKSNKDKKFKYIPGVEAYFHPDLDQWQRDKLDADQAAVDKKAAEKLRKQQEKLQTKIIAVTDENDETEDIEMSNALTIENEEESKSTKHFNPVNRRHHLVLLPKNQKGLQKIFGAVSQGYLKGFYKFPRIDTSMLKEAAKGGDVIAVSACIAGMPAFNVFRELQKIKFEEMSHKLLDDKVLLEKCVTAVGNAYDLMVGALGEGNYFLELQFNKLEAQNLVNRAIIEFVRRNGLQKQLVVTCDAHYAKPDFWRERELYKKLGWMNYKTITADALPKSREELKCELYPKNAQQVWDEYQRAKVGADWYDDDLVADAIERTHDIAHMVIGEVPPDRTPKFPNERLIPPGEKSFNYLVKLCKEGLAKRGLQDKEEYRARLLEELGVIKTMKNSDYFISYQKIMELAREVCLVGPARGSGGGSLVAYVLYITDLDPLKWDLPFARFLSVYRKGAPDIDTDLADRDKVLEQLRAFFGWDNVVPISNYNTFKLKTLVKDIGKFYGVSFEETNAATRTVEEEVRKATTKHGDDKNLFVLKYEDAIVHSKSFKAFIDKYPQVAESIQTLFKQNRSLGRHAGGVLIADDLPNKMPLVTSKGKGDVREPQSPWVEGVNFKHLEKIGEFIKYDLLGLETLRLIERTIELILIKEGNPSPTFKDVKAWYEAHMHPSVIDFDDPKPYEVYAEGKWAGIFQLTSQGAQRLFIKAKPQSVIDIATLTSIYRPGPLAANVDKLYLEAREGKELDWGDLRINAILKKTNTCIIFQEQVMELAEKCAGFPKEQCDEVRRAIMKRSISGGEAAKKAAQETRDGFVKGCVKNGYTESVANNLYDKILYFAGYGFNKSHAVAYAIDSFWCSWLMTYYEEQWMSAYLEAMSGTPEKRAKAFGEARDLGYKFVDIDINHASKAWSVLPGKRFMPSFLSCKGVGESAVDEILANRPYNTIEEMLWNEDGTWKHSKFNKKALEALIRIGAFQSMDLIGPDKLFANYHHMHHVLIEYQDLIKKTSKKDPHIGRKNFYELARKTHAETPAWTVQEEAEFQVEYFGSVDVNKMYGRRIAWCKQKGVKPIDALELGEEANVWFCVQEAIVKKTRNGKVYLQLQVVTDSGKARVNVWGWKDTTTEFEPYEFNLAQAKRDDYGCSTGSWKLKRRIPEVSDE